MTEGRISQILVFFFRYQDMCPKAHVPFRHLREYGLFLLFLLEVKPFCQNGDSGRHPLSLQQRRLWHSILLYHSFPIQGPEALLSGACSEFLKYQLTFFK